MNNYILASVSFKVDLDFCGLNCSGYFLYHVFATKILFLVTAAFLQGQNYGYITKILYI